MLSINDLKPKTIVLIDEQPYQVTEVKHLHMGRGGSSVQTKIKNLITGQLFSRNFKPGDMFEEADIEKRELIHVYAHRGEYVFAPKEKPSERYTLTHEQLGDSAQWLIPHTPVTALFLEDKLLGITVPIKIDFKVTEAPPGLKGDTASGGTKPVTIETGAVVDTPLFINAGDTIRVQTEK